MEAFLKIHFNLTRFKRLHLTKIKEVSIDTFSIAFLDIFFRFSYQYLGWLSYILRPLGLCCLAILFNLHSRYRRKIIQVLLTLTQIICAWMLEENAIFARNYVFYQLLQICLGLAVCYICNINTPLRLGAYLCCFLLAGAILQDEPSWLFNTFFTLIAVLLFILLITENNWIMFANFRKDNIEERNDYRRFFNDFAFHVYFVLMFIVTLVYNYFKTDLSEIGTGNFESIILSTLGLSHTSIYTRGVRLQRVISHKNKIMQFTRDLVDATTDELAEHNDVCSICFQEMEEAKVTSCDHLFHESCLRKWLNTRLICPVCQLQIII
ncbi:RNF145 [Mytilus coruscus]|uniref:RNF145 n=1 Tax=Mytilus coruscus TaxID=42192 RepID=A0A6J8BMK3_MYTCO|nr:RNF145 [Mytilus coruscus]